MTSNLQAMHKMYIVLGDWSGDGHNQSDKVLIEANVPVEELRAAYLQSVAKTGIDFSEEIASDFQDPVAEVGRFRDLGCPLPLIQELVESCYLPEDAEELLKTSEEVEGFFTQDTFLATLMWFISLSLPDLHWFRAEDPVPTFNGYWGPLNKSFGYGLY